MAISIGRYVNILSAVGGATIVDTRELIGRLFSINPLIPSNTSLEFDTLTDVGNYFGTTSAEYKRATFYFNWISKNINSPDKISFARWVNANQAPSIYGAKLTATLSALQAITTGSFTLTLGTHTFNIGALDFSGDISLAAIASTIQVAVRAASVIAQWASATVTYDGTRGSFDFVGGDATSPDIVSVSAGTTGVDISQLIGWFPSSINGAIWSNGSLVQTITAVLTNITNASNNFGSFLFIPTLTDPEVIEAGTWNDGQNNLYIYCVPVTDLTDAQTKSAELANFSGCAITLAPLAAEYPEQIPMMILAATNYDVRNSTQNYMYQQFNVTPSVSTDADANTYDALNVNYVGVTQTAGQFLSFYQIGKLTGTITDATDMNTYANEQWLKDAILAAILNLFLVLSKVSANAQGRAQILSTLQSIINVALLNGTISVNGILSLSQQQFITQITGDPLAWMQVQNSGYWVDCVIVNNSGIFIAKYTLIYKKDDVVRKVEGTDIMI